MSSLTSRIEKLEYDNNHNDIAYYSLTLGIACFIILCYLGYSMSNQVLYKSDLVWHNESCSNVSYVNITTYEYFEDRPNGYKLVKLPDIKLSNVNYPPEDFNGLIVKEECTHAFLEVKE